MNIIETNWKWTKGLSNRARTDYIVLHHAQAVRCSAADVDAWHKSNNWSGIGYHFFVRKDGSIYRGRPIDKTGSHVLGMNNCSVGVCAEGSYEKETVMPAAQKTAIKELLKYLKGIYPNAKVVGHREIGSSDCPGRYYPLEEMKNYCENIKYIKEEIDMEELAKVRAEMAAMEARYDCIINKMGEEIAELKKKSEVMIYDYIDENLPEWARPTIQKLVGNGYLKGDENGKLNLTDDLLRILVITDRAGMYDHRWGGEPA